VALVTVQWEFSCGFSDVALYCT